MTRSSYWRFMGLLFSLVDFGCTSGAVEAGDLLQTDTGADSSVSVDQQSVPLGCTEVTGITVKPLSSRTWEFAIDRNATSVSISGLTENNELAVVNSLTHEGEIWIPSDWWDGSSADLHLGCCVRVASWPGIALALVPSAPTREVPSGTWNVELSHSVEQPRVSARYGVPTGRLILPVLAYYESSLAADVIADNLEEASAMLSAAAEIEFDVLGMSEITEGELRSSDVTRFGPARSDSRDVLHIVFSLSLEGNALGASLVGGPPSQSAVLIDAGRFRVPRTIAHEAMHYLGLWHLTEVAQPDVHDPLSDTPFYDQNNLMSSDIEGGTALSAQQILMSRRHPILLGASNPCD
ncbi:MAG: hypothetical protein VX223_03550 [Myxococcota bacterium]|nr:hypothetical protein [Myxococcota bacterium]